MTHSQLSYTRSQHGFALITTMVLLIMLSILALSQTSTNKTQTQMAANATSSIISFEKTEGALNAATTKMLTNPYSAAQFQQNNNGLYVFDPTATPVWQTVNWSSSAVISSFGGLSGTQAAYIIEQLPSVVQPGNNMKKTTYVYRITSQAVGQNNSSVLLQSTVQIQR